MSRLRKIEERQDLIEEVTSTTIVNADNSLKGIVENTVKETIRQMDKNKDGKISNSEFMIWGSEMLNGQGFKMLLLTLCSITFNFLYDYLFTMWGFEDGGIISMLGKLVAFTILTYGYKTVMTKVDKGRQELMGIISTRDLKIQELSETIQADRLAIEILRHDVERLEK